MAIAQAQQRNAAIELPAPAGVTIEIARTHRYAGQGGWGDHIIPVIDIAAKGASR